MSSPRNSKKIYDNAGYALLFAVLVSSILLSAGLGIANIIYKELLLSSIGRESTRAFYVADTGAECALFWNSKNDFPTLAQLSGAPPWSPPSDRKCADTSDIYSSPDLLYGPIIEDEKDPTTGASYSPARSQASVRFQVKDGSACALVTVWKNESNTTYIESRGFNLDCNTAQSNPRRVERAVRYRIN